MSEGHLMTAWTRSSFCSLGCCLEARLGEGGNVHVRNSRTPEVGELVFTTDEWTAFIAGAKDGEFSNLHTEAPNPVGEESA